MMAGDQRPGMNITPKSMAQPMEPMVGEESKVEQTL